MPDHSPWFWQHFWGWGRKLSEFEDLLSIKQMKFVIYFNFLKENGGRKICRGWVQKIPPTIHCKSPRLKIYFIYHSHCVRYGSRKHQFNEFVGLVQKLKNSCNKQSQKSMSLPHRKKIMTQSCPCLYVYCCSALGLCLGRDGRLWKGMN